MADLHEGAGEPSEYEALTAAAQTWEELAAANPDPETRLVTAYRRYLSSLRAYEADEDIVQLCSARSLIAGLAGDAEADLLAREDASLRLAEVDAMLRDRGDASVCDVEIDGAAEVTDAGSGVDADAFEVDLLPARASKPSPVQGPESDESTPLALTRRLRIAGAVSLGLGAALFGVMTYGLVVDARGGSQLTELQSKAEAGTLTAADWRRIEEITEEGRAGAQIAKVTAVTGGLAVVTGAALLITGHRFDRRRRSSLALTPGVGCGQASLTLKGRF